MCAEWKGANPDEVTVVPNTEFADSTITGQDLLYFMQAKQMGLPISLETIHALMEQNDLTQLSYDDEMATIDSEPPPLGAANVPIVGADGQPVLHPQTGAPLTEPAPKRGVAGTNVAGSKNAQKDMMGRNKAAAKAQTSDQAAGPKPKTAQANRSGQRN